LSKEDAENLNKSLFSEAVMATPFVTGSRQPVEPIRFVIGGDIINDYAADDMQLGNRVSISPVYEDAGKASFFEDDEELDKATNIPAAAATAGIQDVEDKDIMPPPTAPRVRDAPTTISATTISKLQALDFTKTPGTANAISFADGADPTPFDSCKMIKELTQSPGTEATAENSFWSEHGMSPVPLSPFHSPTFTDHLSTTKKKRLGATEAAAAENENAVSMLKTEEIESQQLLTQDPDVQ